MTDAAGKVGRYACIRGEEGGMVPVTDDYPQTRPLYVLSSDYDALEARCRELERILKHAVDIHAEPLGEQYDFSWVKKARAALIREQK